MPRKSKERRAAKRKHAEEDGAPSNKRINLESPLHLALKPKSGNLAANRLAALRKLLSDSLASTSGKPAKVQGTSGAVSARGTLSKEQFKKHAVENEPKTPNAYKSRNKLDDIIIVGSDSPSPAKNKYNEQLDSPCGFIVLSETESSVCNKTPVASANERIRKVRSSSIDLSSTSSSKTLTPDSEEELNRSVVYVKTLRAANIPKSNLFKSPERADERLQNTASKSHATLPKIGAKLIPKRSPLSVKESSKDSSAGHPTKSSLADRLAKIRGSKTPTKPAAANEGTLEEISRAVLVEEWMDSAYPKACSEDIMSESLEVHLNDTILGRSELLSDSRVDESMDWDEIPEPSNTPFAPQEAKVNAICLVTDTNVFMHDLPKVQELLNLKIVGNQKLIIYIPWMVLKELDHFKDNASRNLAIKSQALTAQKLINAALLEPNSKVIGQSVTDVCQQMDLGKDPDDKILASCLQAKAKYTTVVLLSNDINLRNKALTNDLKTYSPRQLVAELKCSKFVKMKVKLQGLLSQIVFQCCKEVYGDACSKMDMLQNCPWSFEGCLKRFRRFWIPVFKELLLKHCLKTVEELIQITDRGDVADSDSSEFDRFRSKIKELLFFLQDIEKYNAAVKKMRAEMDNIGADDCIL